MRSKEVEEAIERIKLHKNMAQTKNYCFITNIINADILLAYIEELEEKNRIQRCQLNDAFSNGFIHKDKIREMMKDCHSKVEGYKENYFENDYKEYLYRKLEELLEVE